MVMLKRGLAGRDGIGFKLTDNGNFDIDGKQLTDVADSIDYGDVVNLKVLKKHTQVSQNNDHLQPSFRFYGKISENGRFRCPICHNTAIRTLMEPQFAAKYCPMFTL